MRAVNLIPTDERGGSGITAGRSGGSVYIVLVLLGGLAVCALLYGLSARQISSRKTQISSLTAQARQAQAHATLLAPYTSFIAMRAQRVQAVSELVDSRFDWAQAFHELGRVLPPNKVSLTSLDGTVGSTASSTLGPPAGPKSAASSSAGATATVTSATPPGSVPVFTITGCATSQAEVALMLERLRLIAGVSEVKLQSSTKSGSAAAGGTGASGAGGSGCESGDPEFNAQVTFEALPSTPAASSSGSGASVTASVSNGASAPAPGAVR
jgi:Tfp pilus assembly protein PilN